MRIPVEYGPGKFVPVELDDELLSFVSTANSFPAALADAFSLACRVPDVWRYTFRVQNGEIVLPLVPVTHPSIPSNYPDRPATDAAGKHTILLALTAPHRDEFSKDSAGRLLPKAPAQSRALLGAGRAIEAYGHLVLGQLGLRDGDYSLLLANPVPYQCSLSSVGSGKPVPLYPDVRNYVWRKLFELEFVRQDFLDRCRLYHPEVVLNCCVPALRTELTTFICDQWLMGGDAEAVLFESEHPAVQWSTLQKRGIPVYHVSLSDGTRTLR
jgi:hypothetical protein